MHWFLSFVTAGSVLLNREAGASRLTPPALPLVVRNPYLSLWLKNAREDPWNRWPMFWTGSEIGFSVLASVPDTRTVYPLLGRPHDSLLPSHEDDLYNVSFATYLGFNYDASTTNLTYLIPAPKAEDPLEIILSFLSPITPTSTRRQAIPASYLTIFVKGSFNIDIYVDLNGQWVSGDRGSSIVWDYVQEKSKNGTLELKTWRVKRETELLFSEFQDQAEWGTLYFNAPSDVRHECGTSASLRREFSRTGSLRNTADNIYRGIMDEEPVFAFAKSFHLNSSRSDSVLFTIAHVQDVVAQFASARGLTFMRPLWASWYSSIKELLWFHYLDYQNAFELSSNYSTQLAQDAHRSGSEDYVDIVALSARQVIGATSFSGTPDDPLLFLKEISSSGNFQTIDVIFPAFPFFLYTNPRWLAYLLEPIIEHTLSGQYPRRNAMHDLGYHFPNATGHPNGNDEYMPVEECGNILIMGLALVNSLQYDSDATSGSVWSSLGSSSFDEGVTESVFPLKSIKNRGDIISPDDSWGGYSKGAKQAKKWVRRSYHLWKQWTEYLIQFSLKPFHQLSTDDFAGPLHLQTNLALKGILGIKAMSQIAQVAGNFEDYEYYKNISEVYISKWETFGISRDGSRAKLSYDWYGSWTTLYNLYADSLLCFHLGEKPFSIPITEKGHQKPLIPSSGKTDSKSGFVPQRIYQIQSDWYHAVRQRYGLPLDSRHLQAKVDWQFFAVSVASKSVRKEILQSVALWINETSTDRPFTDLYETEGTGGFPDATFMARPVIGGTFAPLTLERACGGKATKGLDFLEKGENDVYTQAEGNNNPLEFSKKNTVKDRTAMFATYYVNEI